jgi:biotin carboxylase
MQNNIKKLLIIGANPETIPVVETAKTLSIYTIVTDPDPNAPAKKVADQGIDIDGMNVDGLVAFCEREKIDAVLVGVADRLIEPYQQVCERLNLPCYGNQYQCRMLTNKGEFDTLCKEYRISTIPSIRFYKEDPIDTLQDLQYPVFIKPVDRNSGKGMSVVYNKQELTLGIEKAFTNTSSDFILLERYMTCNDVLLSYTIANGEIILSAMGDRFTTREQSKTSQVCLGAVYPSTLLDVYLTKEHPKIIKMLKGIGLKNAILTISAFVEDNNFYYYDPGFRLQGEAPNLHMESINNFDQKKFLIDVAFGNDITDINITTADFENKHTSTIWFLLKEGTVNKVYGFEQIAKDPAVFHISKRLNEGDVVDSKMIGTESQVLARVYLKCETRKELEVKIKQVYNTVKVFDLEDNNQLLNNFNIN